MLDPEGIHRRFYELCVMAELKNFLRSGDISLAGSRQFRGFQDYLIPHPEFGRRLTQGEIHVAVPTTAAAYIEERMSLLRSALDQTNALAREDQLPDAELNSAGTQDQRLRTVFRRRPKLSGMRSAVCFHTSRSRTC